MSREPINLSGSIMDTILKMSEGNPGAVSALMSLLNRDDPAALMSVLSLDDMNIRGAQIWVGYKDHCGQDIERFAECIKNRDPAMVEKINEVCAPQGITELAVTGGAFFNHVAGQSKDARGMGL